MKKPQFYILIICFTFGCQNGIEQQQQISDSINTEIESNLPSVQIENKQGFNIAELTEIIDSIYQINIFNLDSIQIDTVKDFYDDYPEIAIEYEDGTVQTESEDELRKEMYLLHPLYAFSPQNAKYLFEYGTFSVLKFVNDSIAKSAFTEIFELFKKDGLKVRYSNDSIRLYYNVFSKGGSCYFYKSDFIIHKYRRCNDDYKKHEKYENALLEYLYKDDDPTSGYFMRFCCSCPQNRNREYR